MNPTKTQGAPWLWLLLPLPAMLLGTLVAHRQGVSATAFAMNAIAAALGAGVAVSVRRFASTTLGRASVPMAIAAVLLTASTLLFPGLDGIHRWLAFGPLRIHASAIAVPWVLLGMSASLHRRFAIAAALALGMSAVHAAQPDAGQGTAFALAASFLLFRAPSTPWLPRLLCCAGTLVIGFAAWLRPDPLAAVPHVERIVHLAAGWSPALGVLSVLALALLVVPAVRSTAQAQMGDGLAMSLVVYLAATVGVTELGNFPVPVMGAGAGPILGWYMATGILAASWRRPSTSEHPTPVSAT
ncbi:hypothetical protein P2318_34170 [Myxococcaceae bacterium GXIMD 01537]